MTATKPKQQIKERPIIFSAPMVRAILEGRKTQTRRVVKWPIKGGSPKPLIDVQPCLTAGMWKGGDGDGWNAFECPYGKVGDRLWVREAWAWPGEEYVLFKATHEHIQREMQSDPNNPQFTWKSPLFLPRWASRILLEIVSVRVERVQSISEEDAIAEGVDSVTMADVPRQATMTRRCDYRQLWDKINSKRGHSWDSNPWVWCVSFKRVEATTP